MFKMLTYRITTKFGEVDNFHPAPHTGIDYACPVGTPAQSVSDGVISKIANDSMLGEHIRVNAGKGKEWVYGHLSKVNVTYGEHVNTGDVLGLTGGVPGTPGAGHSTGPHLHLTALQNGVPVDPTIAMQAGSGLSKFWDVLTTPGTELAGIQPIQGPFEIFLHWADGKLIQFVHISPEVFTVIAMALILIGMVGSRKAMRWAGTCILLSFVGVMLDAALSSAR